MDRVIVALREFSLRAPLFPPRGPLARPRLLAVVIGAESRLVYVAVSVIQWNARFFNALGARDWAGFGASCSSA